MKRAIRMNEKDQVATVLEDVCTGDEVGIHDAENALLYTMTAMENIPFGNKIALTQLNSDDLLIKYGAPVGICTRDIPVGHLVHVHNVRSRTVDIPPAFKKEIMRQMNITEVEL